MESYSTVESRLEYWNGATTVFVTLNSGAGSASGDPGYLPTIALVRTFGPLRLGVTIQARPVGGGTAYYLRYGWFADVDTDRYWTVDGTEVHRENYTDPPTEQNATLLFAFDRDTYSLGGGSGSSAFPHMRFAAFTANGSALSHAAVELNTIYGAYGGGVSANTGRRFGPFYRWSLDVDVIDADGTAEVADFTYDGAQMTPDVIDREVEWWLDTTPVGTPEQLAGAAVLADPWLSAQTIRPYTSDRTFVFEGNAPKIPGSASATSWTVGTLTIASPLQVLLSTNAFAAAGSLVVSGPANTPTFTVSATGSSATKTFREHWRSWNGGALNVPGENYTATKRTAYTIDANTPDVWGWSLYSYVDIQFTAAVAGAHPITLDVTWVGIDENSSIRSVLRTYTMSVNGAGTYRVDLLFPDDDDKPFYGERVDSITLAGFLVGTYTLGTFQLVCDSQAYLKIGGRHQDVFGNFEPAGVVLSQDGQFVFAHWNDDSFESPLLDRDGDGDNDRTKDHQNGLMEWAAVETDPVTRSSFGGSPGMNAVSISAVFTELNLLEGMTATYSAATMEADLTDTFSGVIGLDTGGLPVATPRRAIWLTPTLPHARMTAGVAYNVAARLVVDEVIVPAGRTAAQVRLFQRNRLGMALEAQTRTSAETRGGAGQTVTARAFFGGAPVGGDPSIGASTTDAGGFATVPIRTGEYNDAGTYREFSVLLEGS
jgi:hypothetical protein